LKELVARFSTKFGDSIFDEIEFNTTDAFQGREREIIIFSCVRAKATGGIGFLGDIRRMNVGLTRAKSSLWVLGDSRSLQQGEFWSKLIEDSKRRDRYTGGDVMALLAKPTSRDQKPSLEVSLPEMAQGCSTNSRQQSILPRLEPVSNLVTYPSQPKMEDSDVEMADAPSAPSSRKSSIINSRSLSVEAEIDIRQPRELSRQSSPGPSVSSADLNPNGKRKRESSNNDEHGPMKKDHPLKNDKTPDLDASLNAHKAYKPPMRHGSALGVMPPRKKAPADPFIRRKPPARR